MFLIVAKEKNTESNRIWYTSKPDSICGFELVRIRDEFCLTFVNQELAHDHCEILNKDNENWIFFYIEL